MTNTHLGKRRGMRDDHTQERKGECARGVWCVCPTRHHTPGEKGCVCLAPPLLSPRFESWPPPTAVNASCWRHPAGWRYQTGPSSLKLRTFTGVADPDNFYDTSPDPNFQSSKLCCGALAGSFWSNGAGAEKWMVRLRNTANYDLDPCQPSNKVPRRYHT